MIYDHQVGGKFHALSFILTVFLLAKLAGDQGQLAIAEWRSYLACKATETIQPIYRMKPPRLKALRRSYADEKTQCLIDHRACGGGPLEQRLAQGTITLIIRLT